MSEIAKQANISEEAILFIFDEPFFTINKMKEMTGVSYNTAKRYTDELVKRSKVYGDDKKRNKTYSFYDLIEIL